MEKIGTFIMGKSVNSKETFAIPMSNIKGYSIYDSNKIEIKIDPGSLIFSSPIEEMEDNINMLSAIICDNLKQPMTLIDSSMIVTLVSDCKDINLLIGMEADFTVSFKLSEVISVISETSRICITRKNKPVITVNVPTFNTPEEVINYIFNPKEDKTTKSYGIRHNLYKVSGKLDKLSFTSPS